MALPFLPGNTFNKSLGKQKYHLSHHFDVLNEVALNVGEAKPGVGGDVRADQRLPAPYSVIPRGKGSDMPAWVAFDKQALCFDAFFQEPVYERREEQYRMRNCKIYFYPEDDSIQVVEQRLKNTGIPQGTIIRRHRITKPAPNDESYYTIADFNLGKEINLYNCTFKITDADEFTKNFLRKLGFPVMAPLQMPADPYMDHRKAMMESMQPLRPYERRDTLKQFLDHDRHVLRFFCHWDDMDAMYGDPRSMVLHYFLADDTIEIREVLPANCGRDAIPMFLRRARVPKLAGSLPLPGKATDRTVLNVFGPMGHGGRYILDSLKTGAQKQDFYTDKDLMIGAVLNVYGKKFILCDCDDFTKEYLKTKYGITDFTAIECKQPSKPALSKEVAPYNGFGSEEDSLCSTKCLQPSAPKGDFIKFMEKDRRGLDGHVLRFLAKFEAPKPVDAERRFIIAYYLSDDTILIFEPPMKNSGVIGGKFLERGRIKKPGQPRFNTELSQYFTMVDLYVGARVDFNGHRFQLIDADEYCFNYMEQHENQFPQSSLSAILAKIKQLGSIGSLPQPEGVGTMPYEQFRCSLLERTNFALTEHEVMTVARAYQVAAPDCRTELANLITVAQEQLRKANFEDFKKVHDQCEHYDKERIGYVNLDEMVRVFQSLNVPVKTDLLKALLCKLPRGDDGCINYTDLLFSLNWRDNPAPPMGQVTTRPDEVWQGSRDGGKVDHVCYSAFFNDLNTA